MTIVAKWGALTHAGVVRKDNQDAIVDAPPVFAVADGMGGHAAGDIAAQIAVRHLAAFSGAAAIDGESAIAACRSANAEILHRSRTQEELAGMGTTVAGVALSRGIDGDGVLVFNAGDSRIYLVEEGEVVQISTDHSLVSELVANHEITADEARTHPQRNVVTRALGIVEDVTVDTWLIEPAATGSRFLICSDGLTNELSDAELGEVLRRQREPGDCAQELLTRALGRGARDNVSIVVVDVSGTPATEVPVAEQVTADTEPRRPRTEASPVVPASPASALIEGVPDFSGRR